MRLAPIDALVGQSLDFNGSEDYAVNTGGGSQIAPGTVIHAAPTDGIDTGTNVPNWGACELLYALNTSASTFAPGRLVHVDKNFAILDMPVTANTGRPVYVTLTNFAAGNVTTQGGWLLRSGICPVQYSVAATAGAMYGGTAGVATPTLAAGRNLLNATCLIAAASAFTRTGTTRNGSNKVSFARTNGMFFGLTPSGTGIPASTIVYIDPNGSDIFLSANCTATGTVTVTFTPTGFGICQVAAPFVQGNTT
jgi:hypothetical protein